MASINRPIRVALVNDMPEHLHFFAGMLADEQGIRVVTSGRSGADAVRIASRPDIDVMVVNYIMPEMDGLEATRRILTDRPSMKIVLWSVSYSLGDPNFKAILAAQDAGADALLNWPWQKHELVRTLRMVVRGDGFRRIGQQSPRSDLDPLVQLVGRPGALMAILRELLLNDDCQVWIVECPLKPIDTLKVNAHADFSLFTSESAWLAATKSPGFVPGTTVPSAVILDYRDADPSWIRDPGPPPPPLAVPFTASSIVFLIAQARLRRRLTLQAEGAPAVPGPANRGGASMSCRDEILVAATQIMALKGTTTFTISEILQEMNRKGTAFEDSTIRTHVASRMCMNTPKHHAVSYDDLVRVGRGIYKLNPSPRGS